MKIIKSLYKFSISDDLLLSLSMAHSNSIFSSQKELAQHLKKNQLISSELEDQFEKLDRKYFTGTQQQLPLHILYGNYPISLNKYDNMTTPIMHAIPANYILQDVTMKKNYECSILDIGTGRGYIPFLLNMALPKSYCKGVDINPELIKQCIEIDKNIKHLLSGNHPNFEVLNCLTEEFQEQFDYINVGFAIQEDEVQKYLQKVNNFIICPLISDFEQWLTKIDKSGQRVQIMKCLFQSGKFQLRDKSKILKEKESELEEYIKVWQKRFIHKHNRKPSLNDMNNDQQLSQVMKQLKEIKLEIKRL